MKPKTYRGFHKLEPYNCSFVNREACQKYISKFNPVQHKLRFGSIQIESGRIFYTHRNFDDSTYRRNYFFKNARLVYNVFRVTDNHNINKTRSKSEPSHIFVASTKSTLYITRQIDLVTDDFRYHFRWTTMLIGRQ